MVKSKVLTSLEWWCHRISFHMWNIIKWFTTFRNVITVTVTGIAYHTTSSRLSSELMVLHFKEIVTLNTSPNISTMSTSLSVTWMKLNWQLKKAKTGMGVKLNAKIFRNIRSHRWIIPQKAKQCRKCLTTSGETGVEAYTYTLIAMRREC